MSNMATSNLTLEMPVSGAGYCKFPDGTLICHAVLYSMTNDDPVTFPATFYAVPTVLATVTETTTGNVYEVRAYNRTTSGFTARMARVTSSGPEVVPSITKVTMAYIAIGRWKA